MTPEQQHREHYTKQLAFPIFKKTGWTLRSCIPCREQFLKQD